ncbi:hypothetical protein K438DRAFT_1753925 [Mycena galopus ATCC 62051]|nr:hypothetical protein K438DRAFT_1753925 [Mycena galopus ATCC 62051]
MHSTFGTAYTMLLVCVPQLVLSRQKSREQYTTDPQRPHWYGVSGSAHYQDVPHQSLRNAVAHRPAEALHPQGVPVLLHSGVRKSVSSCRPKVRQGTLNVPENGGIDGAFGTMSRMRAANSTGAGPVARARAPGALSCWPGRAGGSAGGRFPLGGYFTKGSRGLGAFNRMALPSYPRCAPGRVRGTKVVMRVGGWFLFCGVDYVVFVCHDRDIVHEMRPGDELEIEQDAPGPTFLALRRVYVHPVDIIILHPLSAIHIVLSFLGKTRTARISSSSPPLHTNSSRAGDNTAVLLGGTDDHMRTGIPSAKEDSELGCNGVGEGGDILAGKQN